MTIQDARAALEGLAMREGVSLASLSRMLGRNAAYLQQFVKRGSPRVLMEEDRRRLAEFFGVEEVVLGGGTEAARAEPRYRLPRLDLSASAGPGAYVDTELPLGTDSLDPNLARRLRLAKGAGAILRVRGTSMEPALFDGDFIVIDTADNRPGRQAELYVLRIGDTVMVKRVAMGRSSLIVRSDNPDAPPIPDGPITITGRVVWQMRAWR